MTTPATPCPHCGRSIAYKPAQHAAICPANPDNRATYRVVLPAHIENQSHLRYTARRERMCYRGV